MRVFVARGTFPRGALELNLERAGQGLMALVAGHGAVRAEKGKSCSRVIEAADLAPRARVVASLASKCSAVRPPLRHPFAKLPMVRILMAGCAGLVGEVKWQHLIGAMHEGRCVTLNAGHRGMSACQREFRLLVQGNREKRALKALHVVAVLAAIIVWRTGKLPVVHVLVAVGATGELHLVNGVLPGGNVAFRAFNGGMFSFKRIARSLVLLDPKQRRLPAFDLVALRALAFRGAIRELAVMRVLVAIGAIREGQRLLELTSGVASRATDLYVRAEQRKLGFGVVKFKSRR